MSGLLARLTAQIEKHYPSADHVLARDSPEQVALELYPIFGAELRSIAEELDGGTAYLASIGSLSKEQVEAAQSVTRGLRVHASQFELS